MRVLGIDPGYASWAGAFWTMRATGLHRWISGLCAPMPGCRLSSGWTRSTPASGRSSNGHSRGACHRKAVLPAQPDHCDRRGRGPRGPSVLAAAQAGIPIYEYTPMQVKQAVTGYGKAVKKQVQEMTRILLHLPAVPKPDDTADALAMAITFCHTNGNQLNRFARRGVGPI